MIYELELSSVAVSDCYIERDKCFVTLEVIDSISYIRKLSVIRRGNAAIIRVKKTNFKRLMGKKSVCFPSEDIERIIIKRWD